MFYSLVRGIVGFALSLFYRLEVTRRVTDLGGPVMFVGNHPNSLIDPALLFVVTNRPVTFLAKEPLFRVPLFGAVLKGLGALPVYRKQDHPGNTAQNEGTLETAARALVEGKAITIFPEGKSHSEPQLSDIKTGCARIALRAARGGAALRIVPVGLTYEAKHRFRSVVHVEVGEPLLVEAGSAPAGDVGESEWVRALTDRVDEALRAVTLNVEDWEDLPLVEMADRLFALRNGYREQDPERLRLLARGAAILRREQSERFDELKDDVLSFRRRLRVFRSDAANLEEGYQPLQVAWFAFRNLVALTVGFPAFALGLVLFAVPFMLLRLTSRAVWLPKDRIATLKVIGAIVVVPTWWTLLTVLGWQWAGLPGLLAALLGSMPLALFTRYFLEQRAAAWDDVLAFLRLGNRKLLRQHLLFQGEQLQEEVQRLVVEFKPRVEASLGQKLPS